MIAASGSRPPRGLRTALLAASLTVLWGCAEPPQKTIDATRAAFTDLRDVARGATWAPDDFAMAESALRQAEDELRRQQSRWAFRRDYGTVLDLFRAAQSDLDAARRAAVSGRQTAEKEAREAVDAAGAAVDHARAAVLVAPVTRDGRAAGGRLDGGLDGAEDRLLEARKLLAEEKYQEALTVAEGIQEEISALLKAVGRARRSGV